MPRDMFGSVKAFIQTVYAPPTNCATPQNWRFAGLENPTSRKHRLTL